MGWVRWMGWLVIAVVALGALLPAVLPSTYHVERSVVIDAPPPRIHALVGDLTEWKRWSPWADADPSLVTTVEVPTGVGARQTWTGEDGFGELTFSASDPSTGVAYDLAIDHGRWISTGGLRYQATEDGTRVSWVMDGQANGWFGRYFAAMMDRMAGPTFEDGLARLKSEVESIPDPATDPAEDGPVTRRADPERAR